MSEEQENYNPFNPKEVKEDLEIAYKVIPEVANELVRQRDKWGVQRHSNYGWLPILMEEVGEVAEAMQIDSDAFKKESDADNLEKELIQTAAVAISWVASIRASAPGEERG